MAIAVIDQLQIIQVNKYKAALLMILHKALAVVVKSRTVQTAGKGIPLHGRFQAFNPKLLPGKETYHLVIILLLLLQSLQIHSLEFRYLSPKLFPVTSACSSAHKLVNRAEASAEIPGIFNVVANTYNVVPAFFLRHYLKELSEIADAEA